MNDETREKIEYVFDAENAWVAIKRYKENEKTLKDYSFLWFVPEEDRVGAEVPSQVKEIGNVRNDCPKLCLPWMESYHYLLINAFTSNNASVKLKFGNEIFFDTNVISNMEKIKQGNEFGDKEDCQSFLAGIDKIRFGEVEQEFNFNATPYIMENLCKKEMDRTIVWENLVTFFSYENLGCSALGNEHSKNSEYELIRADVAINSISKEGRDIIDGWKTAYELLLLILAEKVLINDKSITKLFKCFYDEVGLVSPREACLFKSIYDSTIKMVNKKDDFLFFNPILNLKENSSPDKLFRKINSMAWDLTHLMIAIKNTASKISSANNIIWVTHFATFDRGLAQICSLAPLKAIVCSKDYFLPRLQDSQNNEISAILEEIQNDSPTYEQISRQRVSKFSSIGRRIEEIKESIRTLLGTR